MEWLPLWTILFGAASAFSPPARAAETAKPWAYAVVIGGGRTEADAKKAINEFRNADGGKVAPADGYPKILSSDDIEGAPPNTYMAVLGYCDIKSTALVNKIVQAISSGAYSMPIAGKFEKACPTLVPELMNDNKVAAPTRKKRRD